jgi:hypothetical protein
MPKAVLHLLDSEKGRPLQTWTFSDRETITLGRAEENDIVVADPYVSRAHAYLKHESNGWRLTSISRQQVVFQGETWGELPLSEGSIFRLGPNGCFLRFGEASGEASTNLKTISFDATTMPVFSLDRDKMEREVNQIVEAGYFQQLKQAARQLRAQRELEDTVH